MNARILITLLTTAICIRSSFIKFHTSFTIPIAYPNPVKLLFQANDTNCYFMHTYSGTIKMDPYSSITRTSYITSDDIVEYTSGNFPFIIASSKALSLNTQVGFTMNLNCPIPIYSFTMAYSVIDVSKHSICDGQVLVTSSGSSMQVLILVMLTLLLA